MMREKRRKDSGGRAEVENMAMRNESPDCHCRLSMQRTCVCV